MTIIEDLANVAEENAAKRIPQLEVIPPPGFVKFKIPEEKMNLSGEIVSVAMCPMCGEHWFRNCWDKKLRGKDYQDKLAMDVLRMLKRRHGFISYDIFVNTIVDGYSLRNHPSRIGYYNCRKCGLVAMFGLRCIPGTHELPTWMNPLTSSANKQRGLLEF